MVSSAHYTSGCSTSRCKTNQFIKYVRFLGVLAGVLLALQAMPAAADECPDRQLDTDGDGRPDCYDACPSNPLVIDEEDYDGDGHLCDDQCPSDSTKVGVGLCGCGFPDVDLDRDGQVDCSPYDNCPGDALKTQPGTCGCGISDRDADGDGTADCNDECPDDEAKVLAGRCGCGSEEMDPCDPTDTETPPAIFLKKLSRTQARVTCDHVADPDFDVRYYERHVKSGRERSIVNTSRRATFNGVRKGKNCYTCDIKDRVEGDSSELSEELCKKF